MNAVTETVVPSPSGARLHTEIHGPDDTARPTIVLVHGWTCQIRFWEPVLRLLTPGHRVVLYDQRGHGRTPATPGACSTEALADDLCAVLAATVPPTRRPAVVCGHSMGAMAILAAADRPELRERAGAALLCSTGADRLDPARGAPLRPRTLRLHALRAMLRTRLPYGPVTPLSRRIVRYITLGPDADPGLADWTTRLVYACPRRPRAEWARVLMSLDVSGRLPALALPTTIIHGTADRLTPLPHAHHLARRLPSRPELIELAGVGHMTPLEAPERVAEALRKLVRR
jgi:pimeloyl-ACP methyl ester carboxylesterase